MGVKFWNLFLAEEGWVPRTDGECSSKQLVSLWRQPEEIFTSSAYSSRLCAIPPRSTFHVDGNGLAFLLYETAYHRYVQAGLGEKQLEQLSPGRISQLLPNFLPHDEET